MRISKGWKEKLKKGAIVRKVDGGSVSGGDSGGRQLAEGGVEEQGQSNLCLKTRPGGQRWG